MKYRSPIVTIPKTRLAYRSGAALIISLLILSILMLLAFPLLLSQPASLQSSQNVQEGHQAQQAANNSVAVGSDIAYIYHEDFLNHTETVNPQNLDHLLQKIGNLGGTGSAEGFGQDGVEIHNESIRSIIGLSNHTASSLDALQFIDESMRLDVNTMDYRDWVIVLAAANIRDWDDDVTATVSGDWYPDGNTIGELAESLGYLRYRLDGGKIQYLEQLMLADPSIHSNTHNSIAVRRPLSSAELDQIRPYVTCTAVGPGRNGGIMDLGTLIWYTNGPDRVDNRLLDYNHYIYENNISLGQRIMKGPLQRATNHLTNNDEFSKMKSMSNGLGPIDLDNLYDDTNDEIIIEELTENKIPLFATPQTPFNSDLLNGALRVEDANFISVVTHGSRPSRSKSLAATRVQSRSSTDIWTDRTNEPNTIISSLHEQHELSMHAGLQNQDHIINWETQEELEEHINAGNGNLLLSWPKPTLRMSDDTSYAPSTDENDDEIGYKPSPLNDSHEHRYGQNSSYIGNPVFSIRFVNNKYDDQTKDTNSFLDLISEAHGANGLNTGFTADPENLTPDGLRQEHDATHPIAFPLDHNGFLTLPTGENHDIAIDARMPESFIRFNITFSELADTSNAYTIMEIAPHPDTHAGNLSGTVRPNNLFGQDSRIRLENSSGTELLNDQNYIALFYTPPSSGSEGILRLIVRDEHIANLEDYGPASDPEFSVRTGSRSSLNLETNWIGGREFRYAYTFEENRAYALSLWIGNNDYGNLRVMVDQLAGRDRRQIENNDNIQAGDYIEIPYPLLLDQAIPDSAGDQALDEFTAKDLPIEVCNFFDIHFTDLIPRRGRVMLPTMQNTVSSGNTERLHAEYIEYSEATKTDDIITFTGATRAARQPLHSTLASLNSLVRFTPEHLENSYVFPGGYRLPVSFTARMGGATLQNELRFGTGEFDAYVNQLHDGIEIPDNFDIIIAPNDAGLDLTHWPTNGIVRIYHSSSNRYQFSYYDSFDPTSGNMHIATSRIYDAIDAAPTFDNDIDNDGAIDSIDPIRVRLVSLQLDLNGRVDFSNLEPFYDPAMNGEDESPHRARPSSYRSSFYDFAQYQIYDPVTGNNIRFSYTDFYQNGSSTYIFNRSGMYGNTDDPEVYPTTSRISQVYHIGDRHLPRAGEKVTIVPRNLLNSPMQTDLDNDNINDGHPSRPWQACFSSVVTSDSDGYFNNSTLAHIDRYEMDTSIAFTDNFPWYGQVDFIIEGSGYQFHDLTPEQRDEFSSDSPQPLIYPMTVSLASSQSRNMIAPLADTYPNWASTDTNPGTNTGKKPVVTFGGNHANRGNEFNDVHSLIIDRISAGFQSRITAEIIEISTGGSLGDSLVINCDPSISWNANGGFLDLDGEIIAYDESQNILARACFGSHRLNDLTAAKRVRTLPRLGAVRPLATDYSVNNNGITIFDEAYWGPLTILSTERANYRNASGILLVPADGDLIPMNGAPMGSGEVVGLTYDFIITPWLRGMYNTHKIYELYDSDIEIIAVPFFGRYPSALPETETTDYNEQYLRSYMYPFASYIARWPGMNFRDLYSSRAFTFTTGNEPPGNNDFFDAEVRALGDSLFWSAASPQNTTNAHQALETLNPINPDGVELRVHWRYRDSFPSHKNFYQSLNDHAGRAPSIGAASLSHRAYSVIHERKSR